MIDLKVSRIPVTKQTVDGFVSLGIWVARPASAAYLLPLHDGSLGTRKSPYWFHFVVATKSVGEFYIGSGDGFIRFDDESGLSFHTPIIDGDSGFVWKCYAPAHNLAIVIHPVSDLTKCLRYEEGIVICSSGLDYCWRIHAMAPVPGNPIQSGMFEGVSLDIRDPIQQWEDGIGVFRGLTDGGRHVAVKVIRDGNDAASEFHRIKGAARASRAFLEPSRLIMSKDGSGAIEMDLALADCSKVELTGLGRCIAVQTAIRGVRSLICNEEVHGDVKLKNFVVFPSGIFLIDMGAGSPFGMVARPLGTFGWSPDDKSKVPPRTCRQSDIYTLGMVLASLIGGNIEPWNGNYVELMKLFQTVGPDRFGILARCAAEDWENVPAIEEIIEAFCGENLFLLPGVDEALVRRYSDALASNNPLPQLSVEQLIVGGNVSINQDLTP